MEITKEMMKKISLISLFLLTIFIVHAADNPYFPKEPKAWVNDYANLFNKGDESYLNNKLGHYQDSTSTQIFLVTMNKHGNTPIELMGAEIGESWKVGQKGNDNGMIILVYPADHQISIQTGYGLEEYIPDAIAKRIIENEIKPEFRNNNYIEGLDAATDVIMGLLSGQFTADEYQASTGESKGAGLFGLLFFFIMFFVLFGQSRKRRSYGVGRNVPFWIALSMLSGSRNTHAGSWGDFSSGSGGFGGFSGGGGGGFGGGGASGSW